MPLKKILVFLAILVATALALQLIWNQCSFAADPAEKSPEAYVSLEKAITILQPRTGARRAQRLAGIFRLESLTHGLDPKLLLALSMRESSLDPRVEVGALRGAQGEVGLMQLLPRGAAMRFRPQRDGRHCNPENAGCSVATAARYLNHLRDRCGGSRWVWVGAYSSRRCPSERQARRMQGVRRVKRYFEQVSNQMFGETATAMTAEL